MDSTAVLRIYDQVQQYIIQHCDLRAMTVPLARGLRSEKENIHATQRQGTAVPLHPAHRTAVVLLEAAWGYDFDHA